MRLAAPNSLAFFVQACVSMTEVWYVGRLGRDALAAMALAFPFLMLMQTLSGGALGGAVSSAVARAIGAGRNDRAEALAWHAIAIAVGGALVFALLYALLGPALLARLGGTGAVLSQATAYLGIVFATGASLWLNAILGAVFRGAGDMRFPALVLLAGAFLQVPLSGALILGWWGAPALGITGAALSVAAVASVASLASLVRLARGAGALRLRLAALRFEAATFGEILRVGLGSAPAPILTVFTIVAVNGLVSGFGPAALAGYGIGSRLEFLLIPLVFGIGAALTAMVGTNLGAGNFERALRIAWIGSASAAALTGTIGGVLAIWPGSVGRHVHERPADPRGRHRVPAHRRPLLRVPRPRALALLRFSGRARDVLARVRDGAALRDRRGWIDDRRLDARRGRRCRRDLRLRRGRDGGRRRGDCWSDRRRGVAAQLVEHRKPALL